MTGYAGWNDEEVSERPQVRRSGTLTLPDDHTSFEERAWSELGKN